jgi:hypothetical protein
MSEVASWTFWFGVVWGFSVGAIFMWHWMVKPMARLLGFETDSDGAQAVAPKDGSPAPLAPEREEG